MAAAVGPFIPDHAAQFAQELLDFLVSNLSVAGHDRLVFGEPAQLLQPNVEASSGVLQCIAWLYMCQDASHSACSSAGLG